jgi:site-specific DNA recombinase
METPIGRSNGCVLYARVSTEEQTEKFGLASQLSELRTHAQKVGYKVLRELLDEGYSGGDLGRPALTILRDLIRTKAVSVVLVHDPDRLARKLAHQLLLTEECEKAGARLEFVTTPSADSMEGRLLLNVRGVIAEYEREKIRERTLRGRREKARQGFIVGGRVPYGFRLVNQTYEVDEEQSRVVTQIFQWLVAEKLSIRRIVERLNERGYKPYRSSRWAKSTVSRILRNEIYIGRAFYNRRERVEPQDGAPASRKNKKSRHRWRAESEWIPQSVPPIISPDLFQTAQSALKQNSAHCSGRPAKTFYLLRGLLRCSSCGRKFTGETIFGDKYYRCTGRERLATPRCGAPSIAAKTIEPFVWNYLLHFLSNPTLLATKLAEQESREQDLKAELSRVEKQIREIQIREGRLLNALLDGDVPLPGLREKAKELEQRRLQLQEAQQAIEARMAMRRDRTQLHQTVLRYCEALGNAVSTLEPEAKHKLLRALLDEVVLDGTRVRLKGILPTSVPFGNCPQRQHVVDSSPRPAGIPFSFDGNLNAVPLKLC